MKKLLVVLSLVCVLGIGSLAYYETQGEDIRWEEEVHIDNYIKEDEQIKSLLEYVNSLDYGSSDYKGGSAYASREKAAAEIYIDNADADGSREVLEKIERVLEVEGLVDFVYAENGQGYDKMFEGLQDGNIDQIKSYGDVVVRLVYEKISEEELEIERRYRGKKQEDDMAQEVKMAYSQNEDLYFRDVYIYMMRGKITNPEYEQLIRSIQTPGYYLADMIAGGQMELATFKNSSEVMNTYQRDDKVLNEKGELLQDEQLATRYEIYTQDNQVKRIKGIISAIVPFDMKEDWQLIFNAARSMGLSESELNQLMSLLESTVQEPHKNKKVSIGNWHYCTKYKEVRWGDTKKASIEITLE